MDLPDPNLQWKNHYVMKGMDWLAILASVCFSKGNLHQGNSQVSECFAHFNGWMKMFSPLFIGYILNNELSSGKIVIYFESLYFFWEDWEQIHGSI